MFFSAVFLLIFMTKILPISGNNLTSFDWNARRDDCPTWQDSQIVECQPVLVRQPNFDPSEDASKLHEIIIAERKYDVLKNILVKTFYERFLIVNAYKTKYKTNLQTHFNALLDGNFKDMVLSLLKPMAYFYHDEVVNVLNLPDGIIGKSGIKLNSLLEIIGCLSREGRMYLDMLFPTIPGETGRLCPLIIRHNKPRKYRLDLVLCDILTKSDEKDVCNAEVESDLTDILKARRRRRFTETLNEIIRTRGNAHIRTLLRLYQERTGKDFMSTNKKFYKPWYYKPLPLTITSMLDYCNIVLNRPLYYATRLYNSLKNLPYLRDYGTIRRILISRAEIDLGNILIAFKNKYNMTLADHIQETITDDESDRDYRDILLEIIKNSPAQDSGT